MTSISLATSPAITGQSSSTSPTPTEQTFPAGTNLKNELDAGGTVSFSYEGTEYTASINDMGQYQLTDQEGTAYNCAFLSDSSSGKGFICIDGLKNSGGESVYIGYGVPAGSQTGGTSLLAFKGETEFGSYVESADATKTGGSGNSASAEEASGPLMVPMTASSGASKDSGGVNHNKIANKLDWLDKAGVTEDGDKAVELGLMEVHEDGSVTISPTGQVFNYMIKNQKTNYPFNGMFINVLDGAEKLGLITYSGTSGYSATDLGLVIGEAGYFQSAQNKGWVEKVKEGVPPEWALTQAGQDLAVGIRENQGETGGVVESTSGEDKLIDDALAASSELLSVDITNQDQQKAYDDSIKQDYPALYNRVTRDLGYSSVMAFMWDADNAPSVVSGEVTIDNYITQKIALPSSDGSVTVDIDESTGTFVDSAGTPKFLTNEDVEYVKLVIGEGQFVTFEGEGAGKAANAFMGTYNNSEFFRVATAAAVEQQGGNLGFHMYDLSGYADPSSPMLGWNFEDPVSNERSIYLNNNLTRSLDSYAVLRQTIIHEMGHSFETDSPASQASGINSGESHSRELTAFVGRVINEMENNGIDTETDVDGDDYSANLSILDTDYYDPATDTTAPITPSLPTVFTWFQDTYNQIKDSVASGDFATAQELFDSIADGATITLEHSNPQATDTATDMQAEIYNVKELIVQELLLAADSNSYFDTNINISELNTNVAEFLSQLVANGVVLAGVPLSDVVAVKAEEVGIDLVHDLPGYAYNERGGASV